MFGALRAPRQLQACRAGCRRRRAQVVEVQRREARVDVERVADAALARRARLPPSDSATSPSTSSPRSTNVAAAVERAAAQAAAQLRHVERRVEAAAVARVVPRVAKRPLTAPGHAGSEIAGIEAGQRRVEVPAELRRPARRRRSRRACRSASSRAACGSRPARRCRGRRSARRARWPSRVKRRVADRGPRLGLAGDAEVGVGDDRRARPLARVGAAPGRPRALTAKRRFEASAGLRRIAQVGAAAQRDAAVEGVEHQRLRHSAPGPRGATLRRQDRRARARPARRGPAGRARRRRRRPAASKASGVPAVGFARRAAPRSSASASRAQLPARIVLAAQGERSRATAPARCRTRATSMRARSPRATRPSRGGVRPAGAGSTAVATRSVR